MTTSPSVGIIGAGPGGLALGIFLRKAGFDDVTIFDRESGVGGTWRINTYPGLACDVKSHLYSYSFDLNPRWSRMWSGQREILEYFERCAHRHRLGPLLTLDTEIVSAHWQADAHRWRLRTTDGDEYFFDIVVSAVGLFSRPVMPDLVEEEPFTGAIFHTARWDHSVDLRGAKVAVLGTGSTAAQLIPEIAKVADTVYSVQRSRPGCCPNPTGSTAGGRSGCSPMCRWPPGSTATDCGGAARPTSRSSSTAATRPGSSPPLRCSLSGPPSPTTTCGVG